MANTIYLNNKDSMSMSNGCTDVFLTTIGLSGSRLAVTDGKNASYCGSSRGTSGYGAGESWDLILRKCPGISKIWNHRNNFSVPSLTEYWKNPAGKRWITSLIKTFWRPRFEAFAA